PCSRNQARTNSSTRASVRPCDVGHHRGMRRRYLVLAVVGVLLIVLAAGAAAEYYLMKHRFGGNKVGSSTGFVSTQTAPPPKPGRPGRGGLVRPLFGVGPEPMRVGVGPVRPPLRLDWTANGTSLVEFAPAVAYHNLYYATFGGKLKAISTKDGAPVWGISV